MIQANEIRPGVVEVVVFYSSIRTGGEALAPC
jgi:hypothetical protein